MISDEFEIRVAPPYHWVAFLAYLRPRQIVAIEQVRESTYARVIVLEGQPLAFQISFNEASGSLKVRLESSRAIDRSLLTQHLRRFTDADADPLSIAQTLGTHPIFGDLLGRWPGIRIPGSPDPWELLVRAILGQQVSVGRAAQLANDLVNRFGREVDWPGSILRAKRLFPGPGDLRDAALENLGIPRTRAAAIRRIADHAIEQPDFFNRNEAVVAQDVHEVRGIGPWTTDYFRIRGLGMRDVLPSSDLGIRLAAASVAGEDLTSTELDHRTQDASPFRSYGALCLWTTYLTV